MKTQIKKMGMMLLLLCAFVGARAGFIPVITHTTACQGSDGSIHVSNLQSDGPGPFTLALRNTQTGYSFFDSTISPTTDTFSVFGLAPGHYGVYVLQNSSYSTYTYDTLTIGAMVSVIPTIVNPVCPGNNGSITLSVSGGIGSYTYLWSNTSTASGISGLGAGNYAVTVSDAGGCSTQMDTALWSISPVSVTISNSVNVCSPRLDAVVSGATGTVTYHWSTNATGSYITGTVPYTFYYVTVTDANGCIASTGAYAIAPGLRFDSATTIVSPGCGNNNGSIGVHMANGLRPYTYLWSNSATDSIATGLAAGTYYVTVTDASGCTASRGVSIYQHSGIILDSTVSAYPDCRGNGGTVSAHPLTGVAPYSYLWSNSSTDTIIVNQPAGLYTVTVTDAQGCVGIGTYYLDQTHLYVQLSINASPGCNTATGAVTASVYSYTVTNPSYSYLWSNAATTPSITGLPIGTYEVTVTDATSGCHDTAVATLVSGNSPQAYISNIVNPDCGASNGSLTAIGYYGAGSYSYNWSNSANTATINSLPAGTYTVTITDIGGCSGTASYVLLGYSHFNVAVTSTPTSCDTALHSGTATAIVTGAGTPPYHFAWYNGYYSWPMATVIDTNQTITALSYNEFVSVRVTDNSGCASPSSVYDSTFIGFDPSCYDHILGHAFMDANSNCTFDAGERAANYTYIYAIDGQGHEYYANADSSGFYDIAVLPGTYAVYASYLSYSQCVSPSCTYLYRDTFPVAGLVSSGNDFAIGNYAAFDLGVHPGCTSSTPGNQKQYWVYYYNQGSAAASGASVSFQYDPTLTLVSTSPAYTSLNTSTHTLTWNVGTISAVYSWNYILMTFDVPSSVTLGTVLYAQAEIDPIAGDCNPANNVENISDVVAASHDPNEKQVSPAGNLSASDTVLTYTIRFQNTGTAPASRVVITDQLSPNVNPLTVRAGAASAPYKFTISGTGLITFTFDGINLPDSSHGDSSRGFVTYTVHTMPNLALGSQVDNTANIFFDLNPAVITNTTVNTRSDFPSSIIAIGHSSMSAQVVPNPAHDRAQIEFSGATGDIEMQLTDALGQTVLATTVSSKSYSLDAEKFAPGVYFYTAKDANGNKASGKISIVR